jgi:hypothetical protein
MFDLEKSIAEWRRQMLVAGIKTPTPLEELESHLREDVERQMRLGTSAQQAFEAAIQRIGQAQSLKFEFEKAGLSMEARFVKLACMACGIVAALFSLWILLVLLTAHEPNLIERVLGVIAVAAIILSWRYSPGFLPAIHRQRIRTAIGGLCCLASLGGMMLFIQSILPHFLNLPAGATLPVGQMLVSFVWIWTVMAILGGIGYGLTEADRRHTEPAVS